MFRGLSRCRWLCLGCITAVSVSLLPASHSSAAVMTFESDVVPLGTKYGAGFGDSPGDPVLSEDGINMSVENLLVDGTPNFDHAEIGGKFAPKFDSTPLELFDIAVAFDFSELPFDVLSVTFEVRDFGGTGNFGVNGLAPLELDALGNLPAVIAPGITATIFPNAAALERITLISHDGTPIERFLVGGQEVALDNVTAVPEPATVVLLGLGVAAVIRRRRA